MLAESAIERIDITRLQNLTRLIVSPTATPDGIKLDIVQIIGMFEQELSIQEQIKFIQTLNDLFSINHREYPILIESYFMQIITLIDSTIDMPEDFESMQLAKLSNDSMRMMASAFIGRGIVIPTLLRPEDLAPH